MTSRLTFRDPQQHKAWQRQLRDHYASQGVPDGVTLALADAQIRPVSKPIAKRIILKYEWLGTMAPTTYHYGIFYGLWCAGVTCVGGLSCTGGTNTHHLFNLNRHEVLILARGACVHWALPGTNSKLVSWTCKLLSQSNSGKLIIAYADTDAGEIGTIYQACNWVYIGKGSSTKQWVSPIGRVHDAKHPSNLRKNQGNRFPRSWYVQALKDAGWYEQDTNPKHRYVYVLDKQDKSLMERVDSMRQPYPKREHADT